MYLIILGKILPEGKKKKSTASNSRTIFPKISEALAETWVPYLCCHSFPWMPLP